MISTRITCVTNNLEIGVFDLPCIPANGNTIYFENKVYEVIGAQFNTEKIPMGTQEKNILKQVILTVKEP
jgi:hypothetical protein